MYKRFYQKSNRTFLAFVLVITLVRISKLRRIHTLGPVSKYNTECINLQRKFAARSSVGRSETKQEPSVLIVTAIAANPCPEPFGDYFNLLAYKSKVDYAALHGYHIHLSTTQVNSKFSRNWNKVAVLDDLLNRNLHFDWFMWIDTDILVANLSFVLPFPRYGSASIVVQADKNIVASTSPTYKFNSISSLNSGVMLLRNNNITRRFIKDLMRYGQDSSKTLKAIRGENSLAHEMKSHGLQHFWFVFEQNAVLHLLYTQRKHYQLHAYLEELLYLNRLWPCARNLSCDDGSDLFVVHFAGCQLCGGFTKVFYNDCRKMFFCWNDFSRKSQTDLSFV